MPTVPASRFSAALGALSFALTVGVITWIFWSDRTVKPGMVPILTFCVFGGMAAVLLGMYGIAQARRLLVGGILLGLIGVLSGAATALVSPLVIFSIKHYEAMRYAQPCIEATKQWFMYVGSGNMVSANALAAGRLDESKLTETFEQIEAMGAIGKIEENFGGSAADRSNVEVKIKIDFERGSKLLTTHWDATGRSPVLKDYVFEDHASPATTQSN